MKQPTKVLSHRCLVFISSVCLLSGCQSMGEFFTETHSTTYEVPAGESPRHYKPLYQRHRATTPSAQPQTVQPQTQVMPSTVHKAPSSSPESNLESRGNTLQPKPDPSPSPKIESQPMQRVQPTSTPMVPGAAPTVAP